MVIGVFELPSGWRGETYFGNRPRSSQLSRFSRESIIGDGFGFGDGSGRAMEWDHRCNARGIGEGRERKRGESKGNNLLGMLPERQLWLGDKVITHCKNNIWRPGAGS